jgi:excisionase family DNA binding protein
MSANVAQRHGQLLTLEQVAQRLGVSKRTVQRKVYDGVLPALRLGGHRSPIRVDERELESWLYRQEPT